MFSIREHYIDYVHEYTNYDNPTYEKINGYPHIIFVKCYITLIQK